MTTFKKVLLGIVGATVCGVASAGPMTWTDYYNFNPDRYLKQGDTAIWTHDITDGANGFNWKTDDVSTYGLVFDLYDDQRDGKKEKEHALAWLGASGDYKSFDLKGTEKGGYSLIGYLQLELTGKLTVAITSLLGDFYLGSSTLTVKGVRNSKVPEPGTLALFGTALLGFGLLRRKRIKA